MAGEQQKVEYMTDSDGVKYQVVRTPLDDTKAKRTRKAPRLAGRKSLWPLAAIIILLSFTIIGLLVYKYKTNQKRANNVPVAIRHDVDFPIYIPLASGITIDKDSFDYSVSVLQFNAKNSGTPLHFAEQKKTPEFDISKFAGGIQISGVKQLTLPQGQAVIGTIQDKTIAFMDTGNTIITVTGSQSESFAETIFRSLQKL